MAHLTNFSFEFVYEIFTEDASLLILYHGAKKSKMTKNSNQGGPALNLRKRLFSPVDCCVLQSLDNQAVSDCWSSSVQCRY